MADLNPSSATPSACTPLEQEVLEEYALLLENLNKVSSCNPASLCLAEIILVFRLLADRGLSIAIVPTQFACRPPYSRSPRRITYAGEEDKPGVHAIEGERV